MANRTVRCVHLIGATGEIRTAKFQGREHMVVPVVALVEGVIHPVNAPSPEYVPLDVMRVAPAGWNGRPIIGNHPVHAAEHVSANDPTILDTVAFGQIFNTRIEGNRLLMEAWVDPSRAQTPEARNVIQRLSEKKPVEVSVGAYVVTDDRPGIFRGNRFGATWREIVPDHLAMLPEGVLGACSIAMGCGAMRSARAYDVRPYGLVRHAAAKARAPMITKTMAAHMVLAGAKGVTDAQALSDTDLRASLDEGLRQIEPQYMGIDAVFPEDEEVIYSIMATPTGVQTPQMSYGPETVQMLRRAFTTDKDNRYSFGDRVAVRPVTRFESLTAAEPRAACACEHADEGAVMEKKARVNALIGHAQTTFAEADRAYLDALTDERLAEIEAKVTEIKAVADSKAEADAAVTAAKAAEEQAKAVAQAAETRAAESLKTLSEDEYLKRAPQSIQDIVAGHKAAQAARRADLVGKLKAAQTVYSEERLAGMGLADLEDLAKLTKVDVPVAGSVDYSGRAPKPRAAEADNAVPPPPDLGAAIRAARATTVQ